MIIRAPRYDRFTVLPNDAIRDDRLSWKARGLLVWLLSQPAGWQASSTHLAKMAPDGRDAVRTGLAELEDAGYLRRKRYQDPLGRWRTDTYVHDHPVDNPGDSLGTTRRTEDGYSGVGHAGALSNTEDLILSEEAIRRSTVLEESTPTLCADCHGAGWHTSPLDPNDVERCPRCNPHGGA